MADYLDQQSEAQRLQAEQDRRNEELRQLYALLLKRDPTAQEYGLDREGNRPEVALKIAGQHQKELATGKQGDSQYTPGLTDTKFRDDLRHLLLGFGAEADAGGQFNQGQLTPEQWRKVSTLEQLQGIPVSFLNPSLTVRRDEVDTPEEMTRYLQAHGGDSPLNRQLLQSALDYGGLSIEPTPYGTLSRPGRGLEWQRKSNEPGELESRLTASGRPLTQQELSAIAQERQGNFRLDDPIAIWRQVAKAALAGTFAYAGGAIAGPAIGALGVGAGLPGAAAVPGVSAGSGFAGGLGSVGGGAVGGALGAGVGSGGDPNAIWQGALTGGLGGGLNFATPGTNSPGLSALKGGGIGGAVNLAGQGLKGGDIDWTQLAAALGSGAAGGAASALPGGFPGSDTLTSFGTNIGKSLLTSAGHDPLDAANQKLDQNALQREQDMQAGLQAAQDKWKQQYAAASSEAQAAQLEAFRAAQQQWEQQRDEFYAKRDAFIAERQSQIEEALRAMGLAEPGIASLTAERQKQIAAARAEEEKQQASLVESRNFFPSELLSQTGDQGASGVLVPHSPPPALFGQEGLPVSFGDYSQAPAPEFSTEGFLPSGSLSGPPPSVSPMGPGNRPPHYFPTLLGGLSRSPYLRSA
jgi:hypothetical protein